MIRYGRLALLVTLCLLAACADEPGQAKVSEGTWQMSSQYVANNMLKRDAAITDALKYHQIARLKTDDLPDDVYTRFRAMARNMRLQPAPALYLDSLDERTVPQAMARFTREGKAYIVLNPAALISWSPRELVAVLGHELVHLRNRDVTAENLARAYNAPALSVTHELEADRIGSGPLGSCDPQALESALQTVFTIDRQRLLQDNVIAAFDDYDSLTGVDHPDHEARLAALEEMADNPPAGCENIHWNE